MVHDFYFTFSLWFLTKKLPPWTQFFLSFKLMDSQTIKWIMDDWIKVGTMLVVSRLLAGQSVADSTWQFASLATLIGFTVYQLTFRQFVPTDDTGKLQGVADDWLKVGTMLAVSQMMTGGRLDSSWIKSSLFTLFGFTAYQLMVRPRVDTDEMRKDHASWAGAIDDALKFGTMFLVVQALKGGSLLDSAFITSSLFTILGFAAYQFGTSHLIAL